MLVQSVKKRKDIFGIGVRLVTVKDMQNVKDVVQN